MQNKFELTIPHLKQKFPFYLKKISTIFKININDRFKE